MGSCTDKLYMRLIFLVGVHPVVGSLVPGCKGQGN